MKLTKAIEIKTLYVEHLPPGVNEDWINANKLSIEALKRILQLRYTKDAYSWEPLPGETPK